MVGQAGGSLPRTGLIVVLYLDILVVLVQAIFSLLRMHHKQYATEMHD